MKCPLCGSLAPFEKAVGYHVCTGCSEMLAPSELVKRATRRSRLAYAKANNYHRDYWKTGEPR